VGTELDLPEEGDWSVPLAPEPALPPLATAPPGVLRPIIDQAEAAALLESATSTEQVGEVLADWLRSSFGCGLVLLVRGDVLVGWKGFFLDAEETIPTLSVPIEAPSLFSFAYEARGMYCGPPEPEGVGVDAALWKALCCEPPSEVLVCPVIVGNRVVNILYAHPEDGGPFADDAVCDAQLIAADAAAAYLRLIRQGRERERRDL
jgi:hypothetical protein